MKTVICAALFATLAATSAQAGPRPYASKDGRDCPSGYVGSGDFCRPSAPDAPDAIPNRRGGNCPSGWVSSGNACVQSR